jgi:hypothetical protein
MPAQLLLYCMRPEEAAQALGFYAYEKIEKGEILLEQKPELAKPGDCACISGRKVAGIASGHSVEFAGRSQSPVKAYTSECDYRHLPFNADSCDSSILLPTHNPELLDSGHQTTPDPSGKPLPSCILRFLLEASPYPPRLARSFRCAALSLTVARCAPRIDRIVCARVKIPTITNRHHRFLRPLVSVSGSIVTCDRRHTAIFVRLFRAATAGLLRSQAQSQFHAPGLHLRRASTSSPPHLASKAPSPTPFLPPPPGFQSVNPNVCGLLAGPSRKTQFSFLSLRNTHARIADSPPRVVTSNRNRPASLHLATDVAHRLGNVPVLASLAWNGIVRP